MEPLRPDGGKAEISLVSSNESGPFTYINGTLPYIYIYIRPCIYMVRSRWYLCKESVFCKSKPRGGNISPKIELGGGWGSARPGSVRLGSARPGPARLGSARLGSARLGSARPGSARLGSARLGSALLRHWPHPVPKRSQNSKIHCKNCCFWKNIA